MPGSAGRSQLTPEQLAEIAALMARYGYEEKELMLKHHLVVAMQLIVELEELRLLATAHAAA